MFERLSGGGDRSRPPSCWPRRTSAPRATDERPYTFFNFVSTLDGRAALDGSTRPLGGPADLEMLLALRAVADAVLIGPGTVRAEGYGRLVSPERRAVIAARGADLAPLRHPLGGRAVRGGRPAGADLHVAGRGCRPRRSRRRSRSCGCEECTPAAALADLRARGVRALLERGRPDAVPRLPRSRARRRALPHAHAAARPATRPRPRSCAAARLAGPGPLRAALGAARRATSCSCATRPSASLGSRWSGGWWSRSRSSFALPASAQAADVSVAGGVLSYTAAPGQVSNVTFAESPTGHGRRSSVDHRGQRRPRRRHRLHARSRRPSSAPA